jgi:tetratricopeptide (TPR) repeat protein
VPQQVKIDLGSSKRQRPFSIIEGYKADELVLGITRRVQITSTRTSVTSAIFNNSLGNSINLRRRWEVMLKNSENHMTVIQETTAEIKLNPKNVLALRMRSLAYYINEDGEQGKSDAETMLRLLTSPKTAEEYETQCYSYYRIEKYDEAIAACNRAIKINPQYVLAYHNRGNVYFAQKEYDKAVADFSKVIKIDSQFAWSYRNRGRIYFVQKEYDRAIADYNKAIVLDPTYPHNYGERGLVYEAKKEFDMAIADYTKSIELNPRLAWVYYRRGTIYYNEKKEYNKGLVDFEKAVELEPKNADYNASREHAYKYKQEGDGSLLASVPLVKGKVIPKPNTTVFGENYSDSIYLPEEAATFRTAKNFKKLIMKVGVQDNSDARGFKHFWIKDENGILFEGDAMVNRRPVTVEIDISNSDVIGFTNYDFNGQPPEFIRYINVTFVPKQN